MKSPAFNFRVPIESTAYTWIKKKEEAGVNVSRAMRLLIETHGAMYDLLTTEQNRVRALKVQIAILQNQDSPDFRANLRAEEDKLARIRKAERQASD
jgi:hypothetical protein